MCAKYDSLLQNQKQETTFRLNPGVKQPATVSSKRKSLAKHVNYLMQTPSGITDARLDEVGHAK